jgi:hypothetical protein
VLVRSVSCGKGTPSQSLDVGGGDEPVPGLLSWAPLMFVRIARGRMSSSSSVLLVGTISSSVTPDGSRRRFWAEVCGTPRREGCGERRCLRGREIGSEEKSLALSFTDELDCISGAFLGARPGVAREVTGDEEDVKGTGGTDTRVERLMADDVGDRKSAVPIDMAVLASNAPTAGSPRCGVEGIAVGAIRPDERVPRADSLFWCALSASPRDETRPERGGDDGGVTCEDEGGGRPKKSVSLRFLGGFLPLVSTMDERCLLGRTAKDNSGCRWWKRAQKSRGNVEGDSGRETEMERVTSRHTVSFLRLTDPTISTYFFILQVAMHVPTQSFFLFVCARSVLPVCVYNFMLA